MLRTSLQVQFALSNSPRLKLATEMGGDVDDQLSPFRDQNNKSTTVTQQSTASMSAFNPCGCSSSSYGSYSACSNCGPAQVGEDQWNPLDILPVSNSQGARDAGLRCAQTSPPIFTPPGRCDYQERASRNRYDHKSAFDYGSVYMGSMVPTDVSYPWGYPLGGVARGSYVFSGNDPSYGGYVGDLAKTRGNRSSCGSDPETLTNQCGYDLSRRPCANMSCMGGSGVVTRDSRLKNCDR